MPRAAALPLAQPPRGGPLCWSDRNALGCVRLGAEAFALMTVHRPRFHARLGIADSCQCAMGRPVPPSAQACPCCLERVGDTVRGASRCARQALAACCRPVHQDTIGQPLELSSAGFHDGLPQQRSRTLYRCAPRRTGSDCCLSTLAPSCPAGFRSLLAHSTGSFVATAIGAADGSTGSQVDVRPRELRCVTHDSALECFTALHRTRRAICAPRIRLSLI